MAACALTEKDAAACSPKALPLEAEAKAYLSDYSELLAEWDYAKNSGLDPQKIKHRAAIKAWWKCEEGHEWQALVMNRTVGSGCPVCAIAHRVQTRNLQRVTANGSLATINPALAAEWHPLKNGELKPADVSPSSNKKVWWQCLRGHEWQASVANRNRSKTKCPYCSGRIVISGVNDLATVAPSLAVEWHPTMNGDLRPSDVKGGSEKKVWWQCMNGHVWKAQVKARSAGNGCPMCNKNRKD